MTVKITESEYSILMNVPRTMHYTEVAQKAEFTVAYVSVKIKDLMNKARITFIPDYWKMGLIPAVFMFEYEKGMDLTAFEKPFVTFLGKVIGEKEYVFVKAAVPEERVQEYVNIFEEKPVFQEIGFQELHWNPASPLTVYSKEGFDAKLDEFERVFEKELESQEIFAVSKRMSIDELDLYIIKEKMKDPFKSLTAVGREVSKSQQLVSYHFHKHVNPLWKYNSVLIYQDFEENPLSLFLFEFPDAKTTRAFARTLTHLPYTFLVLQAIPRPLVIYIANIPQKRILKFYRVLHSLREKDIIRKIEYYGYFDTETVKEYTISYKGVLKDGEWIIPRKTLSEVADPLPLKPPAVKKPGKR
ncbi:MAG TPA: hypothetical protein ENF87_01300 [Thermoproteales archaeon]|nr:hypothetical protein [Thermoproteales archaeon]